MLAHVCYGLVLRRFNGEYSVIDIADDDVFLDMEGKMNSKKRPPFYTWFLKCHQSDLICNPQVNIASDLIRSKHELSKLQNSIIAMIGSAAIRIRREDLLRCINNLFNYCIRKLFWVD